MARYGINIVKSVSFRGVQQEFSNRYHYDGPAPAASSADALAANLATKEKAWHSADVSFLRFSFWLDTGSKATSQMISQGTLSGVGTLPTSTKVDRERAILVFWPAGLDSKGRPVYLRKWYHHCSLTFGGVGMTDQHLQQTVFFTAGERTTMATAVSTVETLSTAGDTYTLEGPPGRGRTGGAQAHKWLEHHQLGDMWR